jgi:hypothetical protein
MCLVDKLNKIAITIGLAVISMTSQAQQAMGLRHRQPHTHFYASMGMMRAAGGLEQYKLFRRKVNFVIYETKVQMDHKHSKYSISKSEHLCHNQY